MSGRSHALVAAAAALHVGLSVHAMRGHSATFDEGAHLPAGYTHLALGDHRLNPEQPPLVKLLAAAPLLAVRPALKTEARSWAAARQWEFGQSFLYRWNDADRLLFLGRLPIVALSSCLLVAVFAVALRLFGWGAAAAALSLAALSPDVLAHGGLVTTDLGFALFFFLSVATFARALDEPVPLRLAAAGLATGAAFATKFSAPILVPVFLLLGLLARRPRRLATALAATGAVALLVVWASWGLLAEAELVILLVGWAIVVVAALVSTGGIRKWNWRSILHLRQLVELHWAYNLHKVKPYTVQYAGDW